MDRYQSGCKDTHALVADERDCPVIDNNESFFWRKKETGFGPGDRFPAPLFREIPDDPGKAAPDNDLLHPVQVRHLVEERDMAFRDQGGTKMFGIDPVDQRNICGKCGAGISRGSDRDTSRLCPAGTLFGKDRCMTVVAPAQKDLPKIRRGHLSYLFVFQK